MNLVESVASCVEADATGTEGDDLQQPAAVELCEGLVPSPASSGTGITPDGRRMLAAVENLPEAEREAFDMVRIRGMTQVELARVIGVSVTVPRHG